VTDQDTTILPGPDREGSRDRRYDVRIARRLAFLETRLEDLEGRVAALE
jgi:hypothetical protein